MKIDIKQLEFINKDLRNILLFIEKETGHEHTITSLYRIDDGGVHGTLPLRGTDLRMRNESVGKIIESIVNNKYSYDPARPEKKCAFLHGSGSNLHLHIQVHPNTVGR